MLNTVDSHFQSKLTQRRELIAANYYERLLLEGCDIIELAWLNRVTVLIIDWIQIDIHGLLGRNSDFISFTWIDTFTVLKDDIVSAVYIVLLAKEACQNLSFLSTVTSGPSSNAYALSVLVANSFFVTGLHSITHGIVLPALIYIVTMALKFFIIGHVISNYLLKSEHLISKS